jgi:rhodanese-related sulfurtransferase
MAVIKISTEEFIQKKKFAPVLDVRSPGEYTHAHIPGAYSFPLFTDPERALVGTSYKQDSREAAIKIGLDFFGLKMRKMVEEAEQIINSFSVNKHHQEGGKINRTGSLLAGRNEKCRSCLAARSVWLSRLYFRWWVQKIQKLGVAAI